MAAIGIDFGSTFCRVGVFRNNQFEIVPSETQGRQIPCYVSFKSKRDTIVGDIAQARFLDNIETTFFCPKRLIGRSYEELTRQIADNHWPFVVKDGEKRPVLQVAYTDEQVDVHPIQVYSAVLRKARELATEFLQENVVRAVITIPTKCSESFIEDAIRSAEMAGFVEVKLIEKPLSAALACTRKRNLDYVIAVHLGGGSLGVSVVKMSADSIVPIFSDGDHNIGGVNVDAAIVTWLHRQSDIQKDPSNERFVQHFIHCEIAKKCLSSCKETLIKLGNNDIKLTQNDMMEMEDVKKMLVKIKAIMEKAVAAIPSGSIKRTAVMLVGGSTRLKCVQDVMKCFDIKQNRINSAEEIAVMGAASLASKLWPMESSKEIAASDISNIQFISWTKTEHFVTDGSHNGTNVCEQSKDLADQGTLLNDMESNIYAILRVMDGLDKKRRENVEKECKGIFDWIKGDPIPTMREIIDMKDHVERLKSSVNKETSVSQQPHSLSQLVKTPLLESPNGQPCQTNRSDAKKMQPVQQPQLRADDQFISGQQNHTCEKYLKQCEQFSLQQLELLSKLEAMFHCQNLKLQSFVQEQQVILKAMHDNNVKCLRLLSQQHEIIKNIAKFGHAVQQQQFSTHYGAEQESLRNRLTYEIQQLFSHNDECKVVLETQQQSAIRLLYDNLSNLCLF